MGRRITTAAVLLAFVAVACSSKQEIVIPSHEDVPATRRETIFVATSRARSNDVEVFGAGRSQEVNYARFDVSIPPDRAPGTLKIATSSAPDSATEFFATSGASFSDREAFRRAVSASLAQRSPGEKAVAVYVHGFDNSFPTGLFRKAQIMADFDVPAVPVHYSWPSAGKAKLYLYDRDSAFFARDGLEELLVTLARTGANRIILYAHSMGTQVTVEAVRQMAIRGDQATFSKLHAVILLSPDIDIDLFKREAVALRGRDLPWLIFVSSKDKALKISSVLRGGSERLGSLEDDSVISGTDATIYDLSDVKTDDPVDHQSVAESPTMIALIRGYNEHGPGIAQSELASHGLVQTSLGAVGNASEVLFKPAAQ